MPIYEYRCKSCDHEFEEFIRSGDSEPEACPECETPSVTRLISNTSFKLKGSGWYETDYARADEPEQPEQAAEQADEAAGDDDADTDDSGEDTGRAA